MSTHTHTNPTTKKTPTKQKRTKSKKDYITQNQRVGQEKNKQTKHRFNDSNVKIRIIQKVEEN